MADYTSTSPLKRYLVGFALAVMLTAAPFALVLSGILTHTQTLSTIEITAVLQILVHLYYFLDLRFSPRNPWFLVAIAFTAIILCIMVAGSLWILIDLNRHMMH
jgi:cytochrome o ubiquinol oxidase subunit IV